MALGKNIEMLRKAKGLSMSKLAGAAGTTAQTINKLEKTDAKRSEYAEPLARALGLLDVSWLSILDIQTEQQARELIDLLGQELVIEQLNVENSPIKKLVALCGSMMNPPDYPDPARAHWDEVEAYEQFVQNLANHLRPQVRMNDLWQAQSFNGVMEPPIEFNVTPAGRDKRRIPVLNYVQAGCMTETTANNFARHYDDYITTDRDDLSDRVFALEVKGESMLDRFQEGDRVVIDCDVTPLPGDFVVATNGECEDGEHQATFKKYRPLGLDEQGREVFELLPLNPDYPTMRSDRQPITIIGVMMEHRTYRKRR